MDAAAGDAAETVQQEAASVAQTSINKRIDEKRRDDWFRYFTKKLEDRIQSVFEYYSSAAQSRDLESPLKEEIAVNFDGLRGIREKFPQQLEQLKRESSDRWKTIASQLLEMGSRWEVLVGEIGPHL